VNGPRAVAVLLTGEHNGRVARYFVMTDVEGEPELSGPELEAHAPDKAWARTAGRRTGPRSVRKTPPHPLPACFSHRDARPVPRV
jgi:hypothetical protein